MGNIKLEYIPWNIGTYNDPNANERKVELPVAFWFIKNYSDNLIEIGEVTSRYEEPSHKVYDLTKEHDSTIIMDAADINYKGANVLSISTIEHVGNGEYGPKEPGKAWDLLCKIKKESKNYLISFPVGFNKDFDQTIIDNKEKYFLMFRDLNNNWYKASADQTLLDFEFCNPYYAGNAVAFLSNLDIEFTFGA